MKFILLLLVALATVCIATPPVSPNDQLHALFSRGKHCCWIRQNEQKMCQCPQPAVPYPCNGIACWFKCWNKCHTERINKEW
ncbi:hypothetical protein LY78DRAFT_660516 [Colletotrichum sublineola]|nr:hypothetical protein LY78DRAFT_660516 [Colletotrichum sublineola]